MPRSGPISLSLPAFAGVTRKLILANVAAFFALAILHWVTPGFGDLLRYHLLLEPLAVAHGEIWQLVTYSFLNDGILSILFGMLTLWFTGSILEASYGGPWLAELYGTSVIGGAIIASDHQLHPHLRPSSRRSRHRSLVRHLRPHGRHRHALRQTRSSFSGSSSASRRSTWSRSTSSSPSPSYSNRLTTSTHWRSSRVRSAGFLFVASLHAADGLRVSASAYFEMRNGYYRCKRRRAARKFEVYMRKQNREVHFDKNGRYVDPDELREIPTTNVG